MEMKCKHGNSNNDCPMCIKVIKVQNTSIQVYFIDKTDTTIRRLKSISEKVFKSNEKCQLATS